MLCFTVRILALVLQHVIIRVTLMLPHCPALYCLLAVLLVVTAYFGQINDDDDDDDDDLQS